MSWVTSLNAWATETRCAGPAGFSSARVAAMKPSSTRFWPAFLLVLIWSACWTQWWLVTISPSGDTNDAVQPPSETTALSGDASGSDSVRASIGTPMLRKFSTWNGRVICWGSHIPPGLVYCSRNPSAGSAGAGGGAGAGAAGGAGGAAGGAPGRG